MAPFIGLFGFKTELELKQHNILKQIVKLCYYNKLIMFTYTYDSSLYQFNCDSLFRRIPFETVIMIQLTIPNLYMSFVIQCLCLLNHN